MKRRIYLSMKSLAEARELWLSRFDVDAMAGARPLPDRRFPDLAGGIRSREFQRPGRPGRLCFKGLRQDISGEQP